MVCSYLSFLISNTGTLVENGRKCNKRYRWILLCHYSHLISVIIGANTVFVLLREEDGAVPRMLSARKNVPVQMSWLIGGLGFNLTNKLWQGAASQRRSAEKRATGALFTVRRNSRHSMHRVRAVEQLGKCKQLLPSNIASVLGGGTKPPPRTRQANALQTSWAAKADPCRWVLIL